MAENWLTSYEKCSAIMGYIEEVSGAVQYDSAGVLAYDARIFSYDWDPSEQIVIDYFSTTNAQYQTIYDSLHVSQSTKVPVFQMSSPEVHEAFISDNMVDYSEYLVNLVNAGVPTMIYAGEFDSQDGAKSVEPWLRKLPFTN